MDLETVRVIVSIVSLLFIALIWRILHQILRQLQRIGGRVDAGLQSLHILAADPDDEDEEGLPPVRGLPRQSD